MLNEGHYSLSEIRIGTRYLCAQARSENHPLLNLKIVYLVYYCLQEAFTIANQSTTIYLLCARNTMDTKKGKNSSCPPEAHILLKKKYENN